MTRPELQFVDAETTFLAAFEGEAALRLEKSGVPMLDWKAGGRASKAYPRKEDGQWWTDHGPEMVQSYIEWRDSIQWQLWETPAGLPAVELELKCSFGDVPVRMFIDRVFVTPDGELVIVDMKSGSSKPKDQGLQLGFYASGIEVVFGIRPSYGVYYSARDGGVSAPFNIDHFTPAFLGNLLGEFIRAKEAGLYIPNLGQNCGNCGVRRACAAVRGEDAHLYDPLYMEAK